MNVAKSIVDMAHESTTSRRVRFVGYTIWLDDDDRRHRDDGPAMEFDDGSKVWYKHGVHHRIDGPAISYSTGEKVWLINGVRHRLGGPAVTTEDGELHYYAHGRRFTEGEFYRYVDQETGEILAPPGKRLTYDL